MYCIAEASSARPLYMQLAEREEEKKAEYDAMTKKMFAPPKALDEEDLSFLSQMQEGKTKREAMRAEEERVALMAFREIKSGGGRSSSSSETGHEGGHALYNPLFAARANTKTVASAAPTGSIAWNCRRCLSL
jgi:FAM192A/Fyv6, N-terminal domain